MEQWLPVVGNPQYQVSDQGSVRSITRTVQTSNGHQRTFQGKVLAPSSLSKGHLCVTIPGLGRPLVHRLVLTAFVGPCPPGMEGCHWDGDPTNNTLGNLRWATSSDNQMDKVRHGTHHYAKRTACSEGHEFTPENTYWPPGKNVRYCRICKSESDRRRYAEKKAMA